MKKYLMRGGISVFDSYSPFTVLKRNAIGDNVGNLLYAYGCFRTLFSEETELVLDYYKGEKGYSQKGIDEINETYDGYLIPLADAFRPDFKAKLEIYTSFIRKLKIPVYLIGVGIRAPYEPDLKDGFSFDAEVKAFIKAVLEHSAIVGLRGGITAEYLKTLGFREEIDYTVIGCPSMYSRGRELPKIRTQKLTSSSRISINFSGPTPENVMRMLFSNLKRYPNHGFVGQNINDLLLLYTGMEYNNIKNPLYPSTLDNFLYKENKVHFFVNLPSWFDWMWQQDFTIGGRLHGNVAGVLCGCAPLFIAQDARMRELVEYHHFPCVPASSVNPEMDFQDLLAQVDLLSHTRQHPQNFDHFIDFLSKNGIQSVFNDGKNRTEIPLDKEMEKIDYQPEVVSILQCGTEEGIRRCCEYVQEVKQQNAANQKLKAQKKQTEKDYKELQKKNLQLNKKIKQIQEEKKALEEQRRHPTQMLRYYAKKASQRLKKTK